MWVVALLVEGKLITPDFNYLASILNCTNLTVLKLICFFIGGINVLLGTVLIEYAVLYIPIIITFLFLAYGLILSCIKASYELLVMGNNIDNVMQGTKIKAFLFTLTYLLPFTNQVNYLTLLMKKKYGIEITMSIKEQILNNVNEGYHNRTYQELMNMGLKLKENINLEKLINEKKAKEILEKERLEILNKDKPGMLTNTLNFCYDHYIFVIFIVLIPVVMYIGYNYQQWSYKGLIEKALKAQQKVNSFIMFLYKLHSGCGPRKFSNTISLFFCWKI